MARIGSVLMALILTTIGVAMFGPSQMDAKPIILATPTSTYPSTTGTPQDGSEGLPACTHEDGSGYAQCWWDAATMGNKRGTSGIMGECVVGAATITTEALSDLCMRVWSIPAYVAELGDGATDSWDGKGMVRECTDIEFDAMHDAESRAILEYDGWTLSECFYGMLDN